MHELVTEYMLTYLVDLTRYVVGPNARHRLPKKLRTMGVHMYCTFSSTCTVHWAAALHSPIQDRGLVFAA